MHEMETHEKRNLQSVMDYTAVFVVVVCFALFLLFCFVLFCFGLGEGVLVFTN